MEEFLAGDGTTVSYKVKRSRRRRRTIELSLDPTQGLSVSAPVWTSRDEIDAFVRSRAGWIRRAVQDSQARERHLLRAFTAAETISYLGRSLRLRVVDNDALAGGVEVIGDALEVGVTPAASGPARRAAIIEALEVWLRARAEATLAARVSTFAPIVGVQPKDVQVRRQKTRWGSCGKDGTLYFNWGIVMAPLPVLDYLVVHELTHLHQAGHGRAFWKLVARVLPDFRERRAALRRDGWRYRIS